ncbi:MAG: helix-turn-helix transcriptional regulator [Firmicutes bacterium]|nr:helix-turn-helix transcriptional regulator [Bacillota bacterium]
MGESLLRRVRVSRGMTQKEVALAIGMPQSTYCLIEHGKRPADWSTVQKICDLFEIAHDDLFVPKRFAVRKNCVRL